MKYPFLIAINLVFQCLSYNSAPSQERCCNEGTDQDALPPVLKTVSWGLSFLSSHPAVRERRSALPGALIEEPKHSNNAHHQEASHYSSRSSERPRGHEKPRKTPVRSPGTRHDFSLDHPANQGHLHPSEKPPRPTQPLIVLPPAGPGQAVLLLPPASPGQALHVLPLIISGSPAKPLDLSSKGHMHVILQPSSPGQPLASLQLSSRSQPFTSGKPPSQGQPFISLQPSGRGQLLASLQLPSQSQPLISLQPSSKGQPLIPLQLPNRGQPLISLQPFIQGQPLISLQPSWRGHPSTLLQLPSQGQSLISLKPSNRGQPLISLEPSIHIQPLSSLQPLSQSQPLLSLQPPSQSQPLISLQPSWSGHPSTLLQLPSQGQPLFSLQPSNRGQPLISLQPSIHVQPLNSLQPLSQSQPLLSLQPPSQSQPLISLQPSWRGHPSTLLQLPSQGQPFISLQPSNRGQPLISLQPSIHMQPLSSLQLPSQVQPLISLQPSIRVLPLNLKQLPSQGQPLILLQPSRRGQAVTLLQPSLQLPKQSRPEFSLQSSGQGQPFVSLQSSNQSRMLSLQPSHKRQPLPSQGNLSFSLQLFQDQNLTLQKHSKKGEPLASQQLSKMRQTLAQKRPKPGLLKPSPSPVMPVSPQKITSPFKDPSRLVRRGAVVLSHCGASVEWDSIIQSFHLSKISMKSENDSACGRREAFQPSATSASNEEAERGEFPWMVSLKFSIYHFCSGSILNRWWILTTASCTNIIKNDETSVLVQAGVLNSQLDAPSFHVQLVVSHQEYTEEQESHNLGLILLREPLLIGPLVSPICIFNNMKKEERMTLNNCWLSGWTSLQGGPNIMLKQRVSSLQLIPCPEFWPILSEFIFCMRLNEKNVRTCKGDIGAPLVCKEFLNSSWVQIGLLSDFDKTCLRPYIFTKLSHYMPWIEKSTQATGKPYKVIHINHTRSAFAEHPQRNWVMEKSYYLSTTKEKRKIAKKSFHVFASWQTLIISCSKQICNGVILNKYWIVTTAGCVDGMEPDDTAVYMGLNGPEDIGDVIRADRIFAHGHHHLSNSVGNDIALILLEGPILFWEHVKPLTMERKLNLDISRMDTCGLAGLRWLDSGEGTSSSSVNLVDIQVLVKKSLICPEDEALVRNMAFCIEETNNKKQLLKIQQGSAVLCKKKKKSNWTMIGILSKVLDESPMPAFTTRLAAHINWMNNVSEAAMKPLQLPPAIVPHRMYRSHVPSSLDLLPSLLLMCLAASVLEHYGY